jgi:putative hydrolase of the HAD superfamily
MRVRHVFVDIGGVLGTNGWDREQRQRAIDHFALEKKDFEFRHQEVAGAWEEGRISMDEYMDLTVFSCPREFTRDQFRDFVYSQSEPFPDSIAAIRELSNRHTHVVMTLNNESAELNSYRIQHFGLTDIFSAFLSSCWLNARKPTATFFNRAFGVANANPGESLLIDDREQNITRAAELGMQTIHCLNPADLRAQLVKESLLPADR